VGEGGGRHPPVKPRTTPSPNGRFGDLLKGTIMAKKITGYIKLQVPAASATPSPPIGPALGQRGLNIMEFCKAFNAATQEMEKGAPIPVVITAFADKSFTFEMKLPPVTYFIKKAINLKSGSKKPGHDSAGQLSQAQLRDIAWLPVPPVRWACRLRGTKR
jgi:large subunit ribosomal protein L11